MEGNYWISILQRILTFGKATRNHLHLQDASPQPDEQVSLSTNPSDEVRRVFGRSVHVLMIGGGCGACTLEADSLWNPVYDVERFGFHLVHTPAEADVLLIAGSSLGMESRIQRVFEQMSEPKLVLAVGSYQCEGISTIVPVHGQVAGCPPTPALILHALLAMTGRHIEQQTGEPKPLF